MFDISFSELMLIGVIALIVIGPERLPKVARTVGHLLGRAQRYVNEVKSDIQKEVDLKELGDIKNQMEDAARSVQSSMKSSVEDLKSTVTKPAQQLQDSLSEARQALDITSTSDTADAADSKGKKTAVNDDADSSGAAETITDTTATAVSDAADGDQDAAQTAPDTAKTIPDSSTSRMS